MRALHYTGFGGGADALMHVEIPTPRPKKNELLVKVEASSINPVDWKIQKGMLKPIFPGTLPFIPGSDIAGEVVEVGKCVNDFAVGDKVVSWLFIRGGGAFAEYAVASTKYTTIRPSEVSAVHGACLPIAGLTALQAIRDYVGLKFDESSKDFNLLITGASGGVGHYAVQIAKLCGVHVTATCGARNLELVKSLGADEVLDYKTEEGANLTSPSGRKYDAVVHCAIGIPWSKFQQNLTPRGYVVDVTPTLKTIGQSIVKRMIFSKQKIGLMFMIPRQRDLKLLVDLLRENKIRSLVDSEHTLSNAKTAWSRSMEGHATGKIVIVYDVE